MRVLTVVGARPQFIKAAAVSRVLRAAPGVTEVLVHTGQHYDEQMSAVFFRELAIPTPDHHLGIGSGPHGEQTGRMLAAVEAAIMAERPDWVLVYGDTNSTLAGALAAAKLHVPVAHVEAGLRSGNRQMPEEINRLLTDHACDLLCAPTAAAVANLQREGIAGGRVKLVGDVMYDAARFYGARAARESRALDRFGLTPGGYLLLTVHRAANTDDPARLAAVVGGLCATARDLPVLWPLHPRTRQALDRHGLLKAASPLQLVDPVGYLDMVRLEQQARLIVTDSGGVQKEAFFFGVLSVTLREETEWVELAASGWTRLVPPVSAAAVAAGIQDALSTTPAPCGDLYGDGYSAQRIVAELMAAAPG